MLLDFETLSKLHQNHGFFYLIYHNLWLLCVYYSLGACMFLVIASALTRGEVTLVGMELRAQAGEVTPANQN